MKKIGILGSGIVGQTLANGLIAKGHEVMIGTGHPEKLDEWKQGAQGKGSVGSFEEAADFGSTIILAVKGNIVQGMVKNLGNARLAGKTIIDATNPIADAPPEDGVLRYTTDINYSSMEALQDAAPDAHFVKAFNSISYLKMVDPQFEMRPTMFYCGNNAEAKEEVAKLLEDFGFEPEDMGSAVAARAIEPLCMLYCIPGFTENQWTHGFRLMKS